MASGSAEWMSVEDLMEKVSQKSRQMSTANNISSYSARMRGRSKQPVYTSDKRAKFTQRENKKWVRFMTVLGYIISVSLPALSLSFYYIYIWEPDYVNNTEISRPYHIHKMPILPANRNPRDPLGAVSQTPGASIDRTDLSKILQEGRNSMESSAETSPGRGYS